MQLALYYPRLGAPSEEIDDAILASAFVPRAGGFRIEAPAGGANYRKPYSCILLEYIYVVGTRVACTER